MLLFTLVTFSLSCVYRFWKRHRQYVITGGTLFGILNRRRRQIEHLPLFWSFSLSLSFIFGLYSDTNLLLYDINWNIKLIKYTIESSWDWPKRESCDRLSLPSTHTLSFIAQYVHPFSLTHTHSLNYSLSLFKRIPPKTNASIFILQFTIENSVLCTITSYLCLDQPKRYFWPGTQHNQGYTVPLPSTICCCTTFRN